MAVPETVVNLMDGQTVGRRPFVYFRIGDTYMERKNSNVFILNSLNTARQSIFYQRYLKGDISLKR